jgi:hypothetical protein
MFIDYYDPRLGSVHMESQLWDYMKHIRTVYYPVGVTELIPAHSTLKQLWIAVTKGKTFTFRNAFNYMIDSRRLTEVLFQHLKKTNFNSLSYEESPTHLPIVLSGASTLAAVKSDWSLCQLSDGSWVSEGICLPSDLSILDSVGHGWSIIKLAFKNRCH